MQLRPLSQPDLPLLTDLWVRSWKTLKLDIDFDARRAWLPQHLTALMAGGTKVIAAYAPELAGFVTIDPGSGWLDQICVDPEHFGRNVAKELLNDAKSHAPRGVDLDVIEMNARAIRFYLKEGFKIVGHGVSPRSNLKTLLMRWAP